MVVSLLFTEKGQVADGKLDPRGLFGAFCGLADRDNFKKGIVVRLTNGTIAETCFFTFDLSYFPWRLPGERRLLSDGTFGSEAETSTFEKKELFDDTKLFDDFDLGITPDKSIFEADNTAKKRPGDLMMKDDEPKDYTNKVLQLGDRIVFVFDDPFGACYGLYKSPAVKHSDRRNGLSRVIWDDSGTEIVQLTEARRFRGNDINDIEIGQWAIIAPNTSAANLYSNIFANHVQIEQNVFLRDFNDIADGELFLPVCVDDDGNNGPFTDNEVRRRSDWADWKQSGDTEIEQIYARDVYDLFEEEGVLGQGHMIYPSKMIYTISSKGIRKCRLVVRGDYQFFEDMDDTNFFDDDEIVDEEPEYYDADDVETHTTST